MSSAQAHAATETGTASAGAVPGVNDAELARQVAHLAVRDDARREPRRRAVVRVSQR